MGLGLRRLGLRDKFGLRIDIDPVASVPYECFFLCLACEIYCEVSCFGMQGNSLVWGKNFQTIPWAKVYNSGPVKCYDSCFICIHICYKI